MRNKPAGLIRNLILTAGAVVFVLPGFNTEVALLYALAPWIYLSCFLYYTRTIENRWDWLWFELVSLLAIEIRYRHFMGDSQLIYMAASLLLNGLLAAATVLPYVVDRFYFRHGPRELAVVVFPIFRTIMERIIPGQQFNLSLTQFDNKWLLQSVAFFGEVFLTYIIAFVPSVAVYMLIRRTDRRSMIRGTCALCLCGLTFIVCGARYMKAPAMQDAIQMAYASGPGKTYYEEPTEKEAGYEENAAYLRRTVREAAGKGAKLIAYAEEAFIVSAEEETRILQEAESLARENDIFILICLDSEDADGMFVNKAVFIDNEGELLSDYVKTNLIPVIETGEYAPGDGVIPSNRVLIDGQEHVISYTICYDATFSAYLLAMDEETDLFINPSWDWEEIDDLNYRMQGINAVECGVVLFKPTVDGWSVVTDPYGRVSYKESTLDGDYDQVYYASVLSGRDTTVYERIHDYLAAVWVVLTLIVLLDMGRVVLKRMPKA